MKIDIKKMRADAEKATPGPWRHLKSLNGRDALVGPNVMTRVCSVHWHAKHSDPNGDHLANCDPSTILALLDVVEAARSRVKWMHSDRCAKFSAWSGTRQFLNKESICTCGHDELHQLMKPFTDGGCDE